MISIYIRLMFAYDIVSRASLVYLDSSPQKVLILHKKWCPVQFITWFKNDVTFSSLTKISRWFHLDSDIMMGDVIKTQEDMHMALSSMWHGFIPVYKSSREPLVHFLAR